MRAWLITIGEPLPLTPDVQRMRTAVLAETLLSRGHSVTWWASTFDHFTKKHLFTTDVDLDMGARYRVRALKGCRYRRNISFARYLDHGLVARKFKKLARKEPPPDVIVASIPDYRLAFEAARYARETRIPLVIDVRDQWPDSYLDVVPTPLRTAARFALTRDFEKLRWVLSSADSVVAMVQDYLEWALQHAHRSKRPNDKIFYLGAAQQPSNGVGSLEQRCWSDLTGKFVVTYVGTFGYYNNPLVLIEAARLLQERSTVANRMAFVLGGDGVMRSKAATAAIGLHDVSFPGWVGPADLSQLLRASTVAVLPWSTTAAAFPNKAFHYLQAGLPIAASVTGELQQLLCEYNAGFCFQPGNSVQLAQLLARWHDDARLVETMSANAKQLAEERLNGSQIYAAFAAHVENIAGAHVSSR